MAQAVEVAKWSAESSRSRTAVIAASLALLATTSALATTWAVLEGSAVRIAAVFVVAIAVWMVAQHHPTAAGGLAIVALAETAAAGSALTSFPANARAVLAGLVPVSAAGAVVVAVGWRRATGRVGKAIAFPPLLASALLAIGFNPAVEAGCSHGCVDSPPLLNGVVGSRAVIALAAALTLVSLGTLLLTGVRTGRATAPVALYVASGVCIATVGGSLAWRAILWEASTPVWPAQLLPPLGTGVLGAGTILAVIMEARVRQFVVRLSEALDDSGASAHSVHYAIPGEDCWVDA